MSKNRAGFQKLRWYIVVATLLGLAGDNVWLAYRQSRISTRIQDMTVHRNDQVSTIAMSRRLANRSRHRNSVERAELKRLSRMMHWVRNHETMLVRSGTRVVSQAVSMDYGKVRLLLHIPDQSSENQPNNAHYSIHYAFTEIWGTDYSKRMTDLRMDDPLQWDNRLTLDAVMPGVNQIDFVLDDNDGYQMKVLVNDIIQHQFPVQPFRRPGSTFGPYFTKSYPNQVYGWTCMNTLRAPPPQNEFLKHSFNLTSRKTQGERGGIVIRCWMQSNEPASSSATQAAAFFDTMADDLMKKQVVQLDKLDDLFEPYDGSGRLLFKQRVSDKLLMHAR